MHAVILAGGAGTRLRPLTYARRKELIPLLNRPLLEYRLLNLRTHGVEDIVLACSQGMGEVEAALGDGAALGVRLTYVYEDRPLGSGRAVKEAARAAGATGTLVVCNGDILTNVDLTGMIEQHRGKKATLSISLAAVDDPWHYGVVDADPDLRIKSFVEKPPRGEEPSNLINAGTWLWEPEMLDRIADDETAVRDGFSERVLFPGIIEDGLRAQGFIEDLWVDVGAPDRYLRATALLLERTAQQLGAPVIEQEGAKIDPHADISGLVLIGSGAVIEDGARITGPSVIGPGARIGAGAVIDASVLWEDAVCGERAQISESIIGAGCTVGAGARLDGAILADGATAGAGVELGPEDRLMPGEVRG